MILIIDNYDSFTYNLVQYLGELGAELSVYRNNKIRVKEIQKLRPKKIIISPGPGTPLQGGVSNEVIRVFGRDVPLLGVCLGHQCLAYVHGGEIVPAEHLMHGKTSLIYHYGKTIYKGLINPFTATRYHSLIVKRDTLPACLEIIAETEEKEIMGIKHREYPLWGVQFHPESILTEEGKKLLDNFLKII